MDEPIRIAHFLNQFFAGIGGDRAAGTPLHTRPGPVGPGRALEAELEGRGVVVATLISGDRYLVEHAEAIGPTLLEEVQRQAPHVLVAGPAFDSGVYGLNCAQVCNAMAEALQLPAVTAMFPENPGVELCRRRAFVVPTGRTAASMPEALRAVARLVLKLGYGEPLGSPREEGYLPRGVRRNLLHERTGAERAVAMLLDRLHDRPWESEIPIPAFEPVPPAPPIPDVRQVTVALVTTGGIVPRGNPDRIESRRATRWSRIAIEGVEDLAPADFACVHGGFDGQFANEDPDRVLPVDVIRTLQAEGRIGKVHPFAYATVGNAAPLDRARKFGRAIAAELKEARVGAVLLTAT